MTKIATQKDYVELLREMLKQDEPCGCCPVSKDFSISNGLCENMIKTGAKVLCGWCKDFVDCPETGLCPCGKLKEEALIRAHAAIEQYDAGTHPWNKAVK